MNARQVAKRMSSRAKPAYRRAKTLCSCQYACPGSAESGILAPFGNIVLPITNTHGNPSLPSGDERSCSQDQFFRTNLPLFSFVQLRSISPRNFISSSFKAFTPRNLKIHHLFSPVQPPLSSSFDPSLYIPFYLYYPFSCLDVTSAHHCRVDQSRRATRHH